MTGRIVKALSGFYYVKSENGLTYACRARGKFRKDKFSPLVGDVCDFDITDEKDMEGSVTLIRPRTNELRRPPVANLDQAVVVFAMKSPDPSIYLLTKYLVMLEQCHIRPVIIFQKSDLGEEGQEEHYRQVFASTGYEIRFISVAREQGIDEVRSLLKGHVSTVAGPSGAGKSSLINALLGELRLETGDVSDKTGRGKQTTRHTELIEIEEDTFLFDTPGFSAVELSGVEEEQLGSLFPDFSDYIGDCYFTGCSHRSEPGCAIKQAVESGAVSRERYDAYLRIYEELASARKY